MYREKRKALVASLESSPTGFLKDVAGELQALKKSFGDVSHAIRSAEEFCSLTESPASIYRSIAHMNYNRIWGLDNQREAQLLRLFRRTREQISFSKDPKCARYSVG